MRAASTAPHAKKLAAMLREMIEEDMGLSAEGFARQLNVSAGSVERWMKGENDPFLLLKAWNIAPDRWKLRLLPFIPGEIERWAAAFRRSA